jgi:CO/xanthine dehydrogenase FAD-binding subunit
MRGLIPQYEMRRVKNLEQVLSLLAKEPGKWRPFAGGTDLMVVLEAGDLKHQNYVNIWRLKELLGFKETSKFLRIGAAVTYSEIRENRLVLSEFPMLAQAASVTGALAIQNRGTLGGNIMNASPAADSPPALLCYDAEVELTSLKGSRRVPYAEFHQAYKKTVILPGEMLTAVWIPRREKNAKHFYYKVGTRRAQAISKVCFAACAELQGAKISHARIALGSVGPVPMRLSRLEVFLTGKIPSPELAIEAGELLSTLISPLDDIRSTSRYRLRVAQNLLTQFLNSLRIERGSK